MYNVDSETRKKLYETFGKTEETANEDVKKIHEWLKTQPHHPETMNETMVRNILNLCKYNVEKAKKSIDNYYSYKSKYPELFSENNPKLPHMKELTENIHIFTLPKLLDGLHRIVFIKIRKPDVLVVQDICKSYYNMLELRLQHDFMTDDFIIVDASNLTFKDACKIKFSIIWKAFITYKNVFSLRLNALYLTNSPSYISIPLTILKFVLPPKIFNRIKVYRDAEILKKVLPLEDLPEDYGGNGPSLDQLDAMMKEMFSKFQERFDLLDTLRVDESKRPSKT